jgi:hypothetical protein
MFVFQRSVTSHWRWSLLPVEDNVKGWNGLDVINNPNLDTPAFMTWNKSTYCV